MKKEKKKEKPKIKTPVPGTPWLRVITNAGHVFYTHTERKESVWTIPDEIKEAVSKMERDEKEEESQESQSERWKRDDQETAVEKEIERVKNEIENDVAAKRKAVDLEPAVPKKARVEDAYEEHDDASEDEEDEEDWQREAAEQLAAEAEEERRRRKEEKARELEEAELKRREKEKGSVAISMPNRVDLSIDEAKALFKASGPLD